MNILCVYSLDDYARVSKPLSSLSSIPFGLSYVASSLQAQNCRIQFLVLTPQTRVRKVLQQALDRFEPQLVCFTAVTTQAYVIARAIKLTKLLDESIFTILGGSYASLMPDSAIKILGLDAICIGEGEQPIIELVQKIRARKDFYLVRNIWFKNEGSVIKNEVRPFVDNLDSIPFIDRKLWLPWVDDDTRMASVLVGRGCPYRCSYCSNHSLAIISRGKYVRFRSPGNIVKELKNIVDHFPKIQTIFFDAETLGADIRYAFELLEEIRRFNQTLKTPISYGTNFAVNKHIASNQILFQKLRDSNFKFINVGIESGSEHFRETTLRRPSASNKQLLEFRKLAQKYAIEINMYILVGIPDETKKEFKKTIEFVRQCSPSAIFISIFYPYPGTDLYDLMLERGLYPFLGHDCSLERRRAKFGFPGFSKFQINIEFLFFEWKVYYGKKPWLLLFVRTVRQLTYMSSSLNNLYRYISTHSRIMSFLGKKIAGFWY